jgi:hypothetical protein
MDLRRSTAVMLLMAAMGTVTAAPAAAQSEVPAADGDVVQVRAIEYAFTGLPTSVPVGTSLGLTNEGAEFHELVLVRIGDDVDATLEELLAMEEDPMEAGLVEMVGTTPLFANPGATAEGTLPLEREGRYVAICFIPQGLTDGSALMEMGPDTDPASLPGDIQAILANPPHLALGMVQEFMVTAAGSTPGPLPAAPPAGDPAASAPAEEDAVS